jgi:hypothetical protein
MDPFRGDDDHDPHRRMVWEVIKESSNSEENRWENSFIVFKIQLPARFYFKDISSISNLVILHPSRR